MTFLRRYRAARAALADQMILFVQCGDFFEAIGRDAVRASELLGLVITRCENVAMVGFPVHASGTYFDKLRALGVEYVAIREGRHGHN